jgi:hypothetical protein
MASRFALAAVAAGFGLFGLASAHAALITGSDGLVVTGANTANGKDILSNVVSGGGGVVILVAPTTWGVGTSGFTIPTGTPITMSSLNLLNLGTFGFTSADGNFTGVASMGSLVSGITGTTGSAASGSETVSGFIVGNFSTAGTTAGVSGNTASLTFSLTETGNPPIGSGNLGTISFSGTLAAPAINLVCGQPGAPPCPSPEPASLSLLGAGLASLAGLAAAKRRRRKNDHGDSLT